MIPSRGIVIKASREFEFEGHRESVPHLIVMSQMRAQVLGNSRIAITKKFIWATEVYLEAWPGKITTIVEPSERVENDMDRVEIDPSELNFQIEVTPFSDPRVADLIKSSSAVLVGLGYQTVHIQEWCSRNRVPCIYITEYSLRTREQILDATVKNPLIRFRRKLWNRGLEKKFRRVLAASAGVQCAGTPTYHAYRDINPSPLLFFESRIRSEQIATEDEVRSRLGEFVAEGTLRMLFSGRLTAMKGADQLPLIAHYLQQMGLDFKLSICGAGDSETAIRSEIRKYGLEEKVELIGILDFQDDLLGFAKHACDIFVCPHPQGDPSATYLETMGCGVPIAGYANEALAGMIELSGAGWVSEINNPVLLAKKIYEISKNPEALESATHNAMNFARKNAFDIVFRRRMEHVLALCGDSPEHRLNHQNPEAKALE